MATNLPSCFSTEFLEKLLKFLVNFTLLKYVKSQRSYGCNHKRADFWLPNFGFKRSLLSLLKQLSMDKTLSEDNRGVIKRQFFHMVTHVFIIAISQMRFLQSTPGKQ